eukprot:COSAG03_NODE_2734_length_2490_cov_1739.109996_2_plen_96_part_00
MSETDGCVRDSRATGAGLADQWVAHAVVRHADAGGAAKPGDLQPHFLRYVRPCPLIAQRYRDTGAGGAARAQAECRRGRSSARALALESGPGSAP